MPQDLSGGNSNSSIAFQPLRTDTAVATVIEGSIIEGGGAASASHIKLSDPNNASLDLTALLLASERQHHQHPSTFTAATATASAPRLFGRGPASSPTSSVADVADRREQAYSVTRYIADLRRDIVMGEQIREAPTTAAAAKSAAAEGWKARAKQLTAEFDGIVASMKLRGQQLRGQQQPNAAKPAASDEQSRPQRPVARNGAKIILSMKHDCAHRKPGNTCIQAIIRHGVKTHLDDSAALSHEHDHCATQKRANHPHNGHGKNGIKHKARSETTRTGLHPQHSGDKQEAHSESPALQPATATSDRTGLQSAASAAEKETTIPLDEMRYQLSRLEAENEAREKTLVQSLTTQRDRLASSLDRERDALCSLTLGGVKVRAEQESLRRYIDDKSNEIGHLRKSMRRYGQFREREIQSLATRRGSVRTQRAHSAILLREELGGEVRAVEVEPVRRRRTEIQRTSFQGTLSSEMFEQITAATKGESPSSSFSGRPGGRASATSSSRPRAVRSKSFVNRPGSGRGGNEEIFSTAAKAAARPAATKANPAPPRARSPLSSRRKLRSALRKIDDESQKFHESARNLMGSSSTRNLTLGNDSARSLLSAPAALLSFSAAPSSASPARGPAETGRGAAATTTSGERGFPMQALHDAPRLQIPLKGEGDAARPQRSGSSRASFVSQGSMTSVLSELSLTDLLEDVVETAAVSSSHQSSSSTMTGGGSDQGRGCGHRLPWFPPHARGSSGGSLRDILGVDGDEPLLLPLSPGKEREAEARAREAERALMDALCPGGDDSDLT